MRGGCGSVDFETRVPANPQFFKKQYFLKNIFFKDIFFKENMGILKNNNQNILKYLKF